MHQFSVSCCLDMLHMKIKTTTEIQKNRNVDHIVYLINTILYKDFQIVSDSNPCTHACGSTLSGRQNLFLKPSTFPFACRIIKADLKFFE